MLIKEGTQGKDHLKDVELPAIRKRTNEIEQETYELEAKRNKLFERYKIIKRHLGGP